MSMNQPKLEKMISRMINIIKPNGVANINYELRPMDFVGNSYNMSITYIVPDDSEFLRNFNMRSSDMIRRQWNEEISNTIRDYFDVEIIIGSSGITSESYYKRLKDF